MAKASPAFQFYPGDFLGGTTRMTTSEVGGYILLLCEQWQTGSVPGDDERDLAAIMRCTRPVARTIWSRIQSKFERGDDGYWRNERLEAVRAMQAAYAEESSERGKAGAAEKWRRYRERKSEQSSAKAMPKQAPSNARAMLGASSSVFTLHSSDQSTSVPTSTPSVTAASVWEAITERLQLKPHNREWFTPCVVHRITDTELEINCWKSMRASWLERHFRQRIEEDCADVLEGRRVVFVVKPMSAKVVAEAR